MVMKLLMYAGPHDVFPAMEVDLSILKEMSAACTLISLGENMRKLLDKKVKSMGGCYHKNTRVSNGSDKTELVHVSVTR